MQTVQTQITQQFVNKKEWLIAVCQSSQATHKCKTHIWTLILLDYDQTMPQLYSTDTEHWQQDDCKTRKDNKSKIRNKSPKQNPHSQG